MATTNVIVLLPGIMGSVLQVNGRTVWPGSVSNVGGPYPNLNDLLDPSAVATDVIRNVCISKQYITLIDALNGMGFPEKSANEAGQRLVLCPYDWRKSNVEAAKVLDNTIQAIVKATPDASITLIAHSMGGLVSRYYLESGNFSKNSGFSVISALLMLATPSNGAVAALETILGLRDTVFMSRAQAKQMCADTRYPSSYELLPIRKVPFLWQMLSGKGLTSVDLYDPAVVATLGLSIGNLQTATNFHSTLSLAKKPLRVRYFTFVGTQFQTSTACYLTGSTISPIQPDDSGDGTVPIWASQFLEIEQIQVGGSHSTIYQDKGLLQYLSQLLPGNAPPTTFAMIMGVPPTTLDVQLHVRDQIISSSDAIHMALSIPGLATAPMGSKAKSLYATVAETKNGEIRVEPIILDANGTATGLGPPAIRQTVQAPNPNFPRVNVILSAPSLPGAYRVGYFTSGSTPISYAIVSVKKSEGSPEPTLTDKPS